jgi:hypothetical protein
MSGTVFDYVVAEAFEQREYIVLARSNHCGVLAV